jgi:hypothetical protein
MPGVVDSREVIIRVDAVIGVEEAEETIVEEVEVATEVGEDADVVAHNTLRSIIIMAL